MRQTSRHAPPADAPSPALQMQARAEEASELLKAMANPQRLRVLCLLIEREMSVGEINARVELSQSALSQHLAVLREKNLVNTRREAQTVYYSVSDGLVHDIIETLHGAFCASDGRP
jgi:DNA-binding transcriptional ArsR family regulator